jgi:hypothetical protein
MHKVQGLASKFPRFFRDENALVRVPKKSKRSSSLFYTFIATVALTGSLIFDITHASELTSRADVMLQVDLNRSAVVDRIVSSWKNELPTAQRAAFSEKLMALRADQLIAANVSGSFESVLEIIQANERHRSLQGAGNFSSLDQAKAVGEAARDLVYTPIVPCRLVDTRGAFSPVFSGGAYAPSETRTYQTTGNCGVPAGSVAIATQVIMITPPAAGDIELLPQGAAFGGTVAMVFQANVFSSVSVVARLNESNGQFATQIRGPGGNVAMDVVGYFMPANRDGNGLRIVASTGAHLNAPITINGSLANLATGQGAAVLSGGSSGIGGVPTNNCPNPTSGQSDYGCENRVAGDFATVAGGYSNRAQSFSATVVGGQTNTASGSSASIFGGQKNKAAGNNSVIVGGLSNETVSGADRSVVVGGESNIARGRSSFAGGTAAVTGDATGTAHPGAFIWSDNSSTTPFYSEQANQFAARATGGVRFVTGVNSSGVPISGVVAAAGAGSFTSLSDRFSKTAFSPVKPSEILQKVVALPISTWQYLSQDRSVRHIGPVSQDFKKAFEVGETDKGISTVDADGVAFAAIQGLNQKLIASLKKRDAEIARLNAELAAIKKKLGL